MSILGPGRVTGHSYGARIRVTRAKSRLRGSSTFSDHRRLVAKNPAASRNRGEIVSRQFKSRHGQPVCPRRHDHRFGGAHAGAARQAGGARGRPRGVPSPRSRDPARARAHGDQGRAAGRERHAAFDLGVDRTAAPLIRFERAASRTHPPSGLPFRVCPKAND